MPNKQFTVAADAIVSKLSQQLSQALIQIAVLQVQNEELQKEIEHLKGDSAE